MTGITAVATYGAILSTVVFIWQLLENLRRLKVTCSVSYISDGAGNVETVLSLEGANISKRPISLASYGLKLPNKKQLYFPNDSSNEFPTILTDGRAVTLWRNANLIAHGLEQNDFRGTIKIRGFFRDVTGKEFLSKKMKFDLGVWSQSEYAPIQP